LQPVADFDRLLTHSSVLSPQADFILPDTSHASSHGIMACSARIRKPPDDTVSTGSGCTIPHSFIRLDQSRLKTPPNLPRRTFSISGDLICFTCGHRQHPCVKVDPTK
jgi:hypothetical protein